MHEEHKTKILECPNFIKPFRISNKDSISIDIEIIKTIKYLWSKGIITLGCCQGLKKGKEIYDLPNVIIHEGYCGDDIEMIKNYIKEIDDRKWYILKWKSKLCEISST